MENDLCSKTPFMRCLINAILQTISDWKRFQNYEMKSIMTKGVNTEKQ